MLPRRYRNPTKYFLLSIVFWPESLRCSSLFHLSASMLPGTCFEDCYFYVARRGVCRGCQAIGGSGLTMLKGSFNSGSYKRSAIDPGCLRWVSLTVLRHIDRGFELRWGTEGTVADA